VRRPDDDRGPQRLGCTRSRVPHALGRGARRAGAHPPGGALVQRRPADRAARAARGL
ncbi:MAG: hypothetical protein AVDCRST_MAG06-2521, partial [uncultured Nocardioides sp.]